ncbi:hypothetical protein L7F22_045825 [Adiantum nelumboides]|nr:hypothetical protein [Adiantum nelumboides]
MLLAYSLAFGISLMSQPTWRAMLGVTLVPSILYVALCWWYIPESPRWLVSKGRMVEAKQVLQRLRKRDDVEAELALLVEGLGHVDDVTIEEYILHPANAINCDAIDHKGSHVRIIGADSEGAAWIATPLVSAHDIGNGKSAWSRAGSLRRDSQVNQESNNILPLDPLVAFMGSLQRNAPADGLLLSASFKDSEVFAPFDEENPPPYSPATKDYGLDDGETEQDLSTSLLEEKNEVLLSGDFASPYSMSSPREKPTPLSSFSNFLRGSVKSLTSENFDRNNDISTSNNIGGGWQLAWQWSHEEGKSSDFKTVFLHQQAVSGDGISRAGSMASTVGRIGSGKNLTFQASSLVGTPAPSHISLLAEGSVGPAMLHPVNMAHRRPAWSDIMEPGVRGALVMGCTLQFLQQFSGLNAVLYYTPQILQASGAEGLLANLSKDSTSLLARALLYLKTDFNLDGKPDVEGLIVASAIITAFLSTLCAGPLADWLGRKTMLYVSGVLYTVGAGIMAWSPHVSVLIMGRSLIGVAVGLASAISPLHISECSPPEIRGQLLTFPQLCGLFGMLLAYSLAFGISLMSQPTWRAMLGVTLVPSILYVALCWWYIPESPRWLVSKGRMVEAKQVLQRLRKRDDVEAELALLVEGLGHVDDVTIEEYILHPANAINCDAIDHKGSHVRIIGADSEGAAWIATPLVSAHDIGNGKSAWSRAGSLRRDSQVNQESNNILPLDPLVAFMGSLQRNAPADGLLLSASFKDSEVFAPFDEENPPPYSPATKDYGLDDGETEQDLSTPLLEEKNEVLLSGDFASPYSMSSPREKPTPLSSFSNFLRGSVKSLTSENFDRNNDISTSNNIGGGWQLAWQWSHEEGKSSDFKTVFLHQQAVSGDGISRAGSMASTVGRIGSGKNLTFQASSLVGTPAPSHISLLAEGSVGPAMLHPVNMAHRRPAWSDIMEPGVRGALVMGCTLQFLQQFSGLNAVLYYTPQILQASGAEGLLANLSKDSTSLLASMISGLLVIPFILWAVRLMDTSGRRAILLRTLPILPVCLILVILVKHFLMQGLLQACISFIVMTSFMCCFIMGFGPVPNILCAEIFPTRVRGLCNGICAATMWLSTVFITYGFPATVGKIGLDGVFIIFAVVSVISWVYVYIKVPETKGMPLEVITQLFAVSATTASSKQPEVHSKEGNELQSKIK